MTFDEGPLAARLAAGLLPPARRGARRVRLRLGRVRVRAQRRGATERRAGPRMPARRGACHRRTRPPSTGRPGSAAQQWSGAGWCSSAVEAALTATAHILVTRSGPALQPGPRRYTRSWISDGAMMSAALLRMGHAEEVAEFIRWYAPHQRADGFVPCCVDRAGSRLAGRARQSRRADRAHRRSLPLHG